MSDLRQTVIEAGDSDHVVMARIALLDYHVKRGLLFPGMDERNKELHGLIDALIAAVRQSPPVPPEYENEALARDPIVMAADVAKDACIRRISRAITATKEFHVLPLTAEECITILEHFKWDDEPLQSPPGHHEKDEKDLGG